MTKPYDASTEHRPFELPSSPSKGHPRPRKGQTAKKKMKALNRRDEAQRAPQAPAKKKK